MLKADVGTFEEVAVLDFEASEKRLRDLVLNVGW
jgi:hypothetical protein|tara:strand:+ start:1247 stop:1348 length:102 start_codon:yes stop_codon:yes gene_type:complete